MSQYISVVPSIRVVRGKECFTYQSVETVRVGELVWIPWRSRTLVGVVASTQAEPLAKAKPISGTLGMVLPKAYWQWLQWFSQYYCISLASAVHAALPAFVQHPKLATSNTAITPLPIRIPQRRQSAVQAAVRAVLAAQQSITVLYQRTNEAAAVLMGLIKQSTGAVAIIVPTEQAVNYWSGVLAKFHPKVISAGHQPSIRQAWHALFHHQPTVLLGTKRLSLLPLTEAQRVVVINPEDPAHKQWDQNPRYHVQTAVEQQHQIIHFSYAPRVEQYASQQLVDHLLDQQAIPTVTIVQPTPGQVFADSIISRIEQTDVVAIWHQRTGLGKSLVCSNCLHWIPTIDCTACPQCKSQALRLAGFGTAMLKRRLTELFPLRPIIEVTASQAYPSVPAVQRPIYVGTSAVFERLPWQQVQLVIATSLDAQLAWPNFRSHEYVLQQCLWLRNQVPELVLQTYAMEHPVLQAIQQPFPATWYRQTLTERQRWHYPPRGQYIKVLQPAECADTIVSAMDQLPKLPDLIIDREN